MEVKHNCADCTNRKDFLDPCDWLRKQSTVVLECPHYEKEKNPWIRISDAYSALCDKKGAEDGK